MRAPSPGGRRAGSSGRRGSCAGAWAIGGWRRGRGRRSPGSSSPDAQSLDHAATVLSGRTDPAAGLLAVAIVAAVGGQAGWPAPWREHLRALRRHPDAEVRHAALGPVTYREDDGK